MKFLNHRYLWRGLMVSVIGWLMLNQALAQTIPLPLTDNLTSRLINGTETLVNGGFEENKDNKPKVPDYWKGKNLTGDKHVCNQPSKGKVVAHTGKCAFKFKGGRKEKSQLQYDLPDSMISEFRSGDLFELSLWVQRRKLKEGAKIQVKFLYVNSSLGKKKDGKDVVKIKIPKGKGVYRQYTAPVFVLDGIVKSVRVKIAYKGKSGSMFVDDVSLLRAVPIPTATWTWTPSITSTLTPTDSATLTPTPTATSTATDTPTNTATATSTFTLTPTSTFTATQTLTPTETATLTGSETNTPDVTDTHTPTHTPTATASRTHTASPTATYTASVTASKTWTSTPTATRTPTATPEELVVNSDLEKNVDNDPRVPDHWKVKRAEAGDKYVCNKPEKDKIVAHSGNCAFKFKSSPNENTHLEQDPSDQLISTFEAGDVFSFSAWVKRKNIRSGSHIEVWFKYIDPTLGQFGNGIDRLTLLIAPGTGDYTQVKSLAFTLAGPVKDVEIEVAFKSTTGKMFVDDISLIRLPAAAVGNTSQ